MERDRHLTLWHPAACFITLLLLFISRPHLSVEGRVKAPTAQEVSSKSCRGLHAGILAEVVKRDPPYTEPPFVMVSFVLLNDSETTQDTSADSWKLLIDGTELSDSGWIFGNGPGPSGGWGTLQAGETFQFGKALPLGKYFPEEREYKIAWRAKSFQSPTRTIRIVPKPVNKN